MAHTENFAPQEVSDALLAQAVQSKFEVTSAGHSMVTTRAQSAQNTLRELPFFEELWEMGPVKSSKSKAERRKEKMTAKQITFLNHSSC